MNAILFHSYATMHITPEEGSSYASFETNQKLESYTSLISNVVRAFRPKRFVMTLMADEGGVVQMGENPLFTDSASNAKVRLKNPKDAAEPVPIATGAIANGKVRSLAPAIQSFSEVFFLAISQC